MKIKPLHNHVLIEQEEESELTYGNIIVPDAGKEKPLIGKVIATGPGIFNMNGILIPNIVEVGKKVAFPSFGGQRISLKNKDYLIYKDQDILCVLEDELSDLPSSLPDAMVKELLNIEETVTVTKKEWNEIQSKINKTDNNE